MPKRKATHALVGPARGDRPKRKQATTPAPAEPPVPALGLTDEQLRHLAEEVASRIEPRIGAPSAGNTPSMVNIPTMDNIPANLSDPFEPEPGNSFVDIMNLEHLPQPAKGISSIDDHLGYNVPNNLKVQIANDQYVNLGKLLINNQDPNDDVQFLTCSNGTVSMSQKSKAKPITSIQTWVDAFLIFASIYVTAHPECATALFKYIHTVRLGASRTNHLGWREYDVQFRLKKERNHSISFASVDSELWLIYMHQSLQIQSPSRASEPRPFKCYDFNFKGLCQRNNCFYKHQCLHCDKNHPATKCFANKNRLTFRSAGTQQALRPQAPGTAPSRMPATTTKPLRHP